MMRIKTKVDNGHPTVQALGVRKTGAFPPAEAVESWADPAKVFKQQSTVICSALLRLDILSQRGVCDMLQAG
jgi:hypothetical protein